MFNKKYIFNKKKNGKTVFNKIYLKIYFLSTVYWFEQKKVNEYQTYSTLDPKICTKLSYICFVFCIYSFHTHPVSPSNSEISLTFLISMAKWSYYMLKVGLIS